MATVNSQLPNVQIRFSLKSVLTWLKNLVNKTPKVTNDEYEQYRMNKIMQERVNRLKTQLHAGWHN